MKKLLSRRKLIAGAVGASAALLAASKARWPPAIRGIYGASDAITFAAHRALLAHQPLAREFGREAIMRNFPVLGTANPQDARYQQLLAGRFADWRLPVTGLVSHPG